MSSVKENTLSHWLHELENRHVQEVQLGLSRVSDAAKRLGLLNPGGLVITVAGTNGKGSTVASLESIYTHAGYRTGTYTSPHLLHFNERIKANQIPISDERLVQVFETIDTLCHDILLTYFEITTLAALWYFKEQALDIIILETGLGGRLDATNCIDNDLAIITTIDLDHQALLGHSREEIGYEKAGILRQGKPFIFADTDIPDSVLKQAALCESQCYRNSFDYCYSIESDVLTFHYKGLSIDFPVSSLHPDAVAAAVMAALVLNTQLPLTLLQIQEGIEKTAIAGRLQLMTNGALRTVFDVSHNPQSVRFLAEFVKKQTRNKVHAIFSALADKDLQGMLTPMRDMVDHWYPCLLEGKRALTAEQLLAGLNDNEIKLCHNTPLEAFQTACHAANTGDLIIVYGSFITVADVMSGLYNVT